MPVLKPLVHPRPPGVFEVGGPGVQTLRLEELAGAKLATLAIRCTGRDLFDVASFSRLSVDRGAVRRIALFHGFLSDLSLASLRVDVRNRLTPRDFEAQLRNMVPRGSAPSLEAGLEASRPWLESLLALDRDEDRCRTALLQGRWEPALLFGEMEVNPDLDRHPGIEWRLRNRTGRGEPLEDRTA